MNNNNSKIEYIYSDYAVILPDGLILLGTVMIDFLVEAIGNEDKANDFINRFWQTAVNESENNYFDLGNGTKVEIVKRSGLQQSTNPAICN